MTFAHGVGYLVDHVSSTQAVLYLSILISMWVWEKFAFGGSSRTKWGHSATNLVFMLLALPTQIVLMMACFGLCNWVGAHHWGLLYLLPDADNPWIKYGLMFVVLDMLDWIYHFTMHRVGAFWRFHLMHHTDQALDVSTTVREHPGETVLRIGFLTLWVFICGASVEVLILRQTIETIVNITSHTTFRLPRRAGRIVGWVFITPNLHHAHHHYKLPITNCNYGDVFSIWDRMFGTLVQLERNEIVFGLDTHMEVDVNAGPIQIMFPSLIRDEPIPLAVAA